MCGWVGEVKISGISLVQNSQIISSRIISQNARCMNDQGLAPAGTGGRYDSLFGDHPVELPML